MELPLIYPPSMSAGKFAQVTNAFKETLGDDYVKSDKSTLQSYCDPFPISTSADQSNLCSCVVLPSTVSEVQALVAIANRHSVPLWPFSRGKNNGYGGPACRVRGSVLMDLGRMNRILEVNDECCYALVEPGVTFFDLYNYCKERKLKVYPSVPSLGWGSIVGNTLDRGWGYTPLGEHCVAQCGLEAVLPSGEVIRTGMGGITNSRIWQCHKTGYGPSTDSLFFQSNFGIVTKMGIWLYPKQQGFASCDISIEKDEDLVLLVDRLAHLYRCEVLQNHPVIGNTVRAMASAGPRTNYYFETEGAMPNEIQDRFREYSGKGAWNARFAFYGSESMINTRWGTVTAAFEGLAGCKCTRDVYLADGISRLLDAEEVPTTEMGGTQVGIPNMLRLQTIQYRGKNGGHISFSPVLPPTGTAVLEFYKVGKAISAKHGFDFHAGFHLYPHHLNHLNLLLFDNTSASQKEAAHRCFLELLAAARSRGYSEYRTHLNFMDDVADQFSFNNHIHRKFVESLKDTIDPKGILAPGKSGIWPRSYRKERRANVAANI